MAHILFGTQSFDTDLIIFDKDGTLIEFQHLWAAKTVEAIERLVGELGEDGTLRADLYRSFGYAAQTQKLAADSPMVVAANFKLILIAATVLYQHGHGWLEAEMLAEQHFAPVMSEPPKLDMLHPVTDLPRLFKSLRQAGVRIAVITSDDTAPTEATLNLLGIRQHVGFIACADSQYPAKPNPQAIWAACELWQFDPKRVVMVGDSTTDLETGRRAGLGLRVGVLTGVMGRETLAALASVVLSSIQEIRIA